MYKNIITISAFFCALLLATGAAENKVPEGVWTIGPRTLPPPSAASDAMRKAILKTPAPDVEATNKLTPQTRAQWEAFINETDARAATRARSLAGKHSVTVESDKMGGVNVYRVTPAQIDPKHKHHLFVYLHGGAYIVYSGEAGTTEAILIAARLKMPVLSIDYRMPPAYPAPAGINDVVSVYRQLLKKRTSASMAMGGSSAGGGLTLASVHRFKQLGLDLPGALYLGTPGVDVTKTGDSRYINEGIDRILVSWDGIPFNALKMYAENYDLKHPYVSPIYGDFSGFPPTYLISGTRDLLLSDTVRTHRKMRAAGVIADLNVYEGQSHGDYLAWMDLPESREHYAELNAFLLRYLKN
jgi:monoterpene epsilon-lactone hydrolase